MSGRLRDRACRPRRCAAAVIATVACASAVAVEPPAIVWTPAADARIEWRCSAGIGFADGAAAFDRGAVDSPYRFDPAGARAVFRTSEAQVTVRISFPDVARNATRRYFLGQGAILADGERAASFDRPAPTGGVVEATATWPGPPREREIEVVLPVADPVMLMAIACGRDGPARPAAHRRLRHAAYGDSITQGFWAGDPLGTYPALVGQALGWETVNLGFSARVVTPADAALVVAARPDIVTVMIGINDCLQQVPPERFRANYAALLDGLRAGLPRTPLVLVTPLAVLPGGRWKNAEHAGEYRRAIEDLAAVRRDPALRVIRGPDLLPAERRFFKDGLHPNDAGFAVLAERLAHELAPPAPVP